MSKIKIALGIIVIVCIVGAVYTVIYNQPQGKPEFEIVNFKGMEIPAGYGRTRYQITFKLKNLGTEEATGIHGTIKLGLWNKTWQLYPEDSVLKPEETSPWVIVMA